MKFWQLISAFRLDAPELELVLAADEWAEFAVWYREFNVIVGNGDRGKLDTVVPKTLVRDVAARSSQMFCLSQGVLRHLQNESQGKVLTASEVVERFGGAVIEDVNEFGSANVLDLPSTTD